MAVCKYGSTGDDVTRIQKALKDAGFYQGEPDGVFGPQTETALKNFQMKSGLEVDGIVGPETWGKLFPSSVSEPKVVSGDLDSRCLALTGSFETGKFFPDCFATVTGNFDGQGMSFGALQWNFGQGTLQPLLKEMFANHQDIASGIFGEKLGQLQQAINGGKSAALSFADSIQNKAKHTITDPWKQMFRALGLTTEFQAIEVRGAATYYEKGVRLCENYGLWSERGRALMFDISAQNGSIADRVKALILADFGKLPQSATLEEIELAKMRIVANRQAKAANPKFVEDVRKRKLCIAEGKGIVHGISYDLAGQFGLELRKVDGAGRRG
ncbi:MAG: peptidoglycan-binding protein [Proteobacteria bacterium]|nr:peptidoglycan-binding protein [Pseudomonadota bacterium]MBU4119276.1 peptidoglycan-binding protein [Pseudomonadota bacterium]